MATFKPGQSGNPEGRPKGIADKRVALRALLQPHAEELVTKVVQMAKDGDIAAVRLCLERCMPPLKATDDRIELDGLGDDPAANAACVVKAIGAGELTPNQGATILQAF